MLPANQISIWAEIEGEIRPSGRNPYKVWTPTALKNFLKEKQASFDGNTVTVEKNMLSIRKPRGGNKKISGYKINPLFFVYSNDCEISSNTISFDINKVKQLNPTITAKMFFENLKHNDVKKYYKL